MYPLRFLDHLRRSPQITPVHPPHPSVECNNLTHSPMPARSQLITLALAPQVAVSRWGPTANPCQFALAVEIIDWQSDGTFTDVGILEFIKTKQPNSALSKLKKLSISLRRPRDFDIFKEDQVAEFIKAGLDLHLDHLHRSSQKDFFQFASSWGKYSQSSQCRKTSSGSPGTDTKWGCASTGFACFFILQIIEFNMRLLLI